MSQVIKPAIEAAFLRLPVELIQEIAGYIEDSTDLCAFVSSCRQTYYYVGKDLVHVQCAKAGAKLLASLRRDYEHQEWKSTLDCAAKAGVDIDIFAWILDIYIAHYHQCLNHWSELSPGAVINHGPLNTAIKYKNFEVFQLLLDRGAEILRPGHEPRWNALTCPLRLAIETSSINVARSLIAAGHLTNRAHVCQAVGSNNVGLAAIVSEHALQAAHAAHAELRGQGWAVRDDPALIAQDFWDRIPFDLVFNHGEDKDTRMLEFLIEKGKPIEETDTITRRRNRSHELSYSAPVGIALTSKCPQTAVSLLRQQIQKDLHEPIVIRDIIHRLCRHYSKDQRGKFPEFHATYMTFMEGFHPEFTPYLFRYKHLHVRDLDEDLREGCDFLLSTVLQNCSPSHEVVSYLLANGCTVSTDMLIAELYKLWKSASHCLTRKGRHPSIPVCDGCHKSDGVQSRFANRQCSVKSSLSRLDALLDRMSTEAIDATGTLTEAIYFDCDCDFFECDGCYEDKKSITTPLDFAVSQSLWIVVYRLIHYGADLSLLNKRSKDTIRKMYKETFANGGDIHPLVLDAWDGKFVPDKVEFSSGIDPKRDEQRQALALVMMTTGLEKPPQDKRRDTAGRKGVSHQKRFTGHRR